MDNSSERFSIIDWMKRKLSYALVVMIFLFVIYVLKEMEPSEIENLPFFFRVIKNIYPGNDLLAGLFFVGFGGVFMSYLAYGPIKDVIRLRKVSTPEEFKSQEGVNLVRVAGCSMVFSGVYTALMANFYEIGNKPEMFSFGWLCLIVPALAFCIGTVLWIVMQFIRIIFIYKLYSKAGRKVVFFVCVLIAIIYVIAKNLVE